MGLTASNTRVVGGLGHRQPVGLGKGCVSAFGFEIPMLLSLDFEPIQWKEDYLVEREPDGHLLH